MKIFLFVLMSLLMFTISKDLCAQSFSFHGGFKPDFSPGSHFSIKCDIRQNGRWKLAVNYALVKFTYTYAKPNVGIGLHLENKRDQTIIDFPELDRGYVIQKKEIDLRPREIYHHFSIFIGYNLLNSDDFISNIYLGPHFSLNRDIDYDLSSEIATITINDGDEPKNIYYNDYAIYRSWDLGIGSRIELEYKLFQNVSIGLSSQMFFDILEEGIDLILGGGMTYHFSPSSK